MSHSGATIKDVAELAGVSPTTVSHVLNDKGRIEPSTRERVQDAARRLNYRPSRAARSLRTQRTGTLAFLVPKFEGASAEARVVSIDVYMNQAMSAAKAAFAHDHALLLVPPTATAVDLRALGVDGGIVCDPLRDDPLVGALESLNLPYVTIERELGRPSEGWYVSADNERSTTELLDHLAAAGAERIALLAVDLPIAWAGDCVAAYRAWCERNGREPIVALADPHGEVRGAHAMAAHLLVGSHRPDAIIASDERFPSAVIRAARERGLSIPDDLLLATCIDSHEARVANPPVTAIDIQPERQGEAAAELLIARLEGRDVARPRTTAFELRIRASSRRD
jgi:DNA-binding LacI/PurR family transcriptional regulator